MSCARHPSYWLGVKTPFGTPNKTLTTQSERLVVSGFEGLLFGPKAFVRTKLRGYGRLHSVFSNNDVEQANQGFFVFFGELVEFVKQVQQSGVLGKGLALGGYGKSHQLLDTDFQSLSELFESALSGLSLATLVARDVLFVDPDPFREFCLSEISVSSELSDLFAYAHDFYFTAL